MRSPHKGYAYFSKSSKSNSIKSANQTDKGVTIFNLYIYESIQSKAREIILLLLIYKN